MNCKQVEDLMIDLVASKADASADLSVHMAACPECARQWQSLKSAMDAMEDWKSPEPSPFFDTRFQARLAELKREEAAAPAGAFAWLRKPAFGMPAWRPLLAGVLTLAFAVGIGVYQQGSSPAAGTNAAKTEISPAVSDLQKLDKNEDLYADFELLDDLQTSDSKPAAASNAGSKAEL